VTITVAHGEVAREGDDTSNPPIGSVVDLTNEIIEAEEADNVSGRRSTTPSQAQRAAPTQVPASIWPEELALLDTHQLYRHAVPTLTLAPNPKKGADPITNSDTTPEANRLSVVRGVGETVQPDRRRSTNSSLGR
jgi:hypothetical protein